MRIAVLGTGTVGQTIGRGLVALGHEVCMGSRSAANEAAAAFAAETGAGHGTFADAAAFGELVVNATPGAVSLDALRAAGAGNLDGKVLLDASNPLDFSAGFPPTLTVANTDSVGEQIQREFPGARVVKALNTISSRLMLSPGAVPGEHHLPICGDDAGAKAQVVALLGEAGWPPERFVDLGGIDGARGMEMYLALWVRLYGALGSPDFNVAILRA